MEGALVRGVSGLIHWARPAVFHLRKDLPKDSFNVAEMGDELNKKTRQQFVNKTRQKRGVFKGGAKRKSIAAKGF
jgi:hypothetical protein